MVKPLPARFKPRPAYGRGIFEFRCWVPKGGWQWIVGEELDGDQGQEKMFLVPVSPIEGSGYEPLQDEPALYREFAEIEATPEGILRFANQWGGLEKYGVDFRPKDKVKFPSRGPSEDPRFMCYHGETFETWEHSISMLSSSIQLWDMIQAGDIKGIEEQKSVRNFLNGERPTIEEIRNAGLGWVQAMVNMGLGNFAQPKLLFNENKSRLAIYIAPHNLRGAFWLQFARAIEGDIRYARCVECSRWMEIAIGSGRPDKKYCSNACRMRRYRERRAARLKVEKESRK